MNFHGLTPSPGMMLTRLGAAAAIVNSGPEYAVCLAQGLPLMVDAILILRKPNGCCEQTLHRYSGDATAGFMTVGFGGGTGSCSLWVDCCGSQELFMHLSGVDSAACCDLRLLLSMLDPIAPNWVSTAGGRLMILGAELDEREDSLPVGIAGCCCGFHRSCNRWFFPMMFEAWCRRAKGLGTDEVAVILKINAGNCMLSDACDAAGA
ncbi:hypothetical protein Nepgr_025385 [Nepenthes gracilis]|uniref:Uncharacterized protein n=1 Tax=Nepenthes gracilis TaxID=150966 RepID=A0AAD3T6B9_NEPGR|nr:hypothetical protein Nepgr_025385 [Nepenthes gracilis]